MSRSLLCFHREVLVRVTLPGANPSSQDVSDAIQCLIAATGVRSRS